MNAPLAPETLVFNRYRVVGLAGQGEFGLTYLAQDQKRFDELCILKEFIPVQQDPAVLEMQRQCFHQEAAVLYELQHPQIPRFRIMFAHENRLYLVRDYVVGKSNSALLSERNAEGRLFSQAEVLQLLVQTLPALAYIHRFGLIHQNLSPKSLVLRRQDQLPVLISFGLVKQLVVKLQLHSVPPNIAIGAEGYAPPEQRKSGTLSPSSDLYALAATAIALLTGKEPRELHHRWTHTLDWDPEIEVHPELVRLLKHLLHPNPQKRFTSASQALRALVPILSMIPQSVPPIRQHVSVPWTQHSVSLFQPQPPGNFDQETQPETSPDEIPPDSSPDSSTETVAKYQNPPGDGLLRPIAKQSLRKLSQKPRRVRSGGDFRASAILVMSIALLVSVVSLRTLSWVQTEPSQSQSPSADPASSTQPQASPSSTPDPTRSDPSPSLSMPTREPGSTASRTESVSLDTLRDRRRQIGVDLQFLSDLTDELFYAKHPQLQEQKLGDTAEQRELRNEWTTSANDVLSKLETLSPETRGKLGSYQREDYDRWLSPDNGASLNGQELNVLVNNRFGELFPDQKDKTLNPKTFGQVWYAIAEEELNKLKPQ
ncbi:MAG: protein kinase [Leptolyngbyaceae cyanobacterium RU_5_1]|nr:protein kinase [Leptolyngbyaceae cyanobacterium RU_5_1]